MIDINFTTPLPASVEASLSWLQMGVQQTKDLAIQNVIRTHKTKQGHLYSGEFLGRPTKTCGPTAPRAAAAREGVLMCAFSFMNSKRYKSMLNKRREVSGRACYLCVAAYLLPIRSRARSRSPALHGVYHYSWNSSTEGVRPCVLRALTFEYWDAGSLFSGAERVDATRRRCNMSSHYSGSSGGIRFGDCLAKNC